ncbi:MAG: potassium channel protein [candidate division Zixibacteria bacterium]|nr:potassium channel protein [candidate division Zixibacteria bacterium]MBU1470997.1 potassium channel protein [candidate division Zixibacteria bacterium]MBU2623923.1 potassium channel protein [candidate division Zixibacteria bacterium]
MIDQTAGPEVRLKFVASFMVVIILSGVAGYVLIEDASFLDALYMTVITLTTVGFREAVNLHESGKIFTIILLLTGVGTLFYAAGLVVQMFLEGQIGSLIEKRRMDRRITKMKDHYVVAGYGRVGQAVCKELRKRGKHLVVIENNPDLEEILKQNEKHYIPEDATQDEVLVRASISSANALISTIAEEAHNVYLTLSARQMNPDLFIIARADTAECQKKLYRAGASRVICPHELGGLRMAMATIRPNLVDFMQIGTSSTDLGLSIEEVKVKAGSRLVGVPLKDSGIRSELDLMVVGIKKEGLDMIINPAAGEIIGMGDILIVIGEDENLSKFDEYVST